MPSEPQQSGEGHGPRRTVWIAVMAGAAGIAAGAGVVLALVFAVLWILERPTPEMRAAVASKAMQSPPPTSARLAESPVVRRNELHPPSATTESAAVAPERALTTDVVAPPAPPQTTGSGGSFQP